jgi:hypothetical protein
VASFAQIVPAMINALKIVRVKEIKAGMRRANPLELLLWGVWWFFELAFVPALAVLSMRVVNAIV